MAFERVRQFFTRQTGRATTPKPRVAEQRKRVVPDGARFRVERTDEAGQVYQGYAGPKGADAVKIWEDYQNDPQYRGLFEFWDGVNKRGEFRR